MGRKKMERMQRALKSGAVRQGGSVHTTMDANWAVPVDIAAKSPPRHGRTGMELVEQGQETRTSDASLLRSVAAGEPAAVRALMDDHVPIVYGFVLARVGGNESTAEDIIQETLIEGVRSAESFRGDSSLSTWLCTIARRRIARHWERERRHNEAATALVARYEEPHMVVDVRDEVVRALGNLAPLHRQILVMKYLDDYSVEQIAAEVGRPRVQVQSLLQRARDALRRQLEPSRG